MPYVKNINAGWAHNHIFVRGECVFPGCQQKEGELNDPETQRRRFYEALNGPARPFKP